MAASCALASACSTTDLLKKFNSGLLDSTGDPNHEPAARHRAMVKELIVHEMMDGYFTQGTPNGAVANWLSFAAQEPHAFLRAVYLHAKYSGNSLGVAAPAAPRASATVPDATDSSDAGLPHSIVANESAPKQRFTALGAYWRRTPLPVGVPICNGPTLNTKQAGELADALRFDAAVERAGTAVTALAIEGLANLAEIEQGAKDAFAELHEYIGHRRWQRQFDRHVNGLVVKGGASTGMYSAGVVWIALNLIHRCLDDAACKAATGDPRFKLISGTSTGAMIAVVTDLFNNANTTADRQAALDKLANWFTCTGSNELYCVRDANALEMLTDQRGLMEFDGLETLLGRNVSCDALRNDSELVLNTVDFRTGNLYDLSDQDELRRPVDVVQGALASAVLPFIAKPIPHLPVDYDPRHIEQTYLDGGIRAELPILPLVRRGAERVLVVASSASVTSEMRDLPNGMTIAIRYIDVSTGGVTESEIAHAERQVESVRLAEMYNCEHSDAVSSACANDARCVTAFCESRWSDVCGGGAAKAPKHDSNPLDLSDQRLASLWQTRSFFRDEDRIEPLHGYDFDPTKQRQLFQAGADAARLRCGEIATLLGMPEDHVATWCAPVLAQCKDDGTHASTLRTCDAPPPAASTEVCR
ncbi:MAG TPA: patatin-like phospholipase family protein [Polyangiaceae bacterium]|nr:patatin-like phospholipase family protein [Polyangiaceae bacterium]